MTTSPERLRRNMIRRWFDPAEHEPANAYFSRLAGLNNQTSARVFADEMGFDGRTMEPAPCLDAVSHLAINGMEGLIHATPVVTKRVVRMLGVEVRRKHWSADAPRVCPGCLAESPHFRTYHGLVSFTVCPFHGCEIVEGTGAQNSLAWWHPHFDRAPDGTMVAQAMPRLKTPLPSFELWLLGRLGIGRGMSVHLLDVAPVSVAIDAVDLLGRAALGGWRDSTPRTETPGFSRTDVVAKGFSILRGGVETIECLFEDIVDQGEREAGRDQRGLYHAFGWLHAALFHRLAGPVLLEEIRTAAAVVAKRRGSFARSSKALMNVSEPSTRLHQGEVGRMLGINAPYVASIARRLGHHPIAKAGLSNIYESSVVESIRAAIANCVKRDMAACVLGLTNPELAAVEQLGLLRPLCRLGGSSVDHNLYLRSELSSLLNLDRQPYVSSEDKQCLDIARLAEASGSTVLEIIGSCATGRLVPVGRLPGSAGLLSLAFKVADIDNARSAPPLAVKPGGRIRRQRSRLGVTKTDAASTLRVTMETVAALVREGHLLTVDPSKSGTLRPRIDERSLHEFAASHLPTVECAEALGCGRSIAVQKLRELGIDIIPKLQSLHHAMAMVRRDDVAHILETRDKRLSDEGSEWKAFWSAFDTYLISKSSIMRIRRIPNGNVVRLRSTDWRTMICVEISPSGLAIVQHEARQTSREAGARAPSERTGFQLETPEAWPEWFEWLELTTYLLRSHGDLA